MCIALSALTALHSTVWEHCGGVDRTGSDMLDATADPGRALTLPTVGQPGQIVISQLQTFKTLQL